MSTRSLLFSTSCAAGLFLAGSMSPAPAQEKTPEPPQLVTYWGVAANPDGKPKVGVAGVTFSLYADEQGGAPLWMETQNVQLDSAGGYTAQIGATHPDGLPIGLFASGQARWLDVQVDGQPAAQRVLLMSVPYALKAVDAQTLGGLPASAFALAGTAGHAASGASAESARPAGAPGAANPATAPATAVTGSGTAGTVPIWTAPSTLGNSVITQKSGNVGIGSSPTAFKLGVSNTADNGIAGISASSTGIGVEGDAVAGTGVTTGVLGTAASTGGVGVEGNATAASGTTTGVYGLAASPTGVGVEGNSTTTGVLGVATGGTGTGVIGQASALSGNSNGVAGLTASSTGAGLVGTATATSGLSYGVYATNASANGIGINGLASDSTGGAYGIYGGSAGTIGVGVYGYGSNATGVNYGVVGGSPSSAGTGVYGFANSTSGSGTGVYGTTSGATGSTGVWGVATGATGITYGVYGSSISTTGYGVKGTNTSSSGSATGVGGLAYSPAGMGVTGTNFASTGTAYGVYGQSDSNNGVGVFGSGLSTSTIAGELLGNNAAGVWGDNYEGTAGVIATAGAAQALVAYNSATNVATLFVENQTDGSDTAVVVATYSDYGGYCDIMVNGNLICSGSVGGHAYLGADASREVSLYAVQAPENWFEDMGSGQLQNGAAVVTLDADYAQTVNTGMDYHVFLTPNGDCKGLYVSQKSANSFEVHELGGGSSSIAFDYRVVARRKGYENIRFASLTGKIQRQIVKPENAPPAKRAAGEFPAPRSLAPPPPAPAGAARPVPAVLR